MTATRRRVGLTPSFAPGLTADFATPSPSSMERGCDGGKGEAPILETPRRPALSFFQQTAAVLKKDLMLEWRTKEMTLVTLIFGLLALVIFTFALDLRTENAAEAAPGALWVAVTFGGALALGRSFALEHDRGTLDGLLLSPLDRGALFFAKAAGNTLFMVAVEAVLLVVFTAFFNLPVLRPGIVPVLLLGTTGFASVGTLFAAMAANTRAREVLLPVLLFPVEVPVVLGSVKATAAVIDGSSFGPWLGLLAAFDAIFLVVAYWVFEHVVED